MVALVFSLARGQRGVGWLDGPELALAAGTLGVAHPPGEPGWVSTAALAALLPVGDLSERLLLASALAAAVAAGLVAEATRRLLSRWSPAAAAPGALLLGLLVGVQPALVAQGARVELYAPMAALLAAAAFALSWSGPRAVALAVLPLAVAGAVHHLLLVAAAPAVLWLVARRPSADRRAFALATALLLGPGLLQFAYLPLRSWTDPVLDFGSPRDLQSVLWVVSGRAYAGSFELDAGDLAAQLGAHLRLLVSQLGPIAALAVAGAVSLRRRGSTAVVAALLLGTCGLAPTALQGVFSAENPDAWGYLLPVWTLVCLLAVVAWVELWGEARGPLRLGVALATAGVLVAWPLLRSVQETAGNRSRAAERLGAALLHDAPPGAIVFPLGDSWTLPAMYLRYREGRRPDVDVVGLEMATPRRVERLRDRYLAAPGGPVPADLLAHVLAAGSRPVAVSEGLIPVQLLERRVPRGLLYELDGRADGGADQLWERAVQPTTGEVGFADDRQARRVLSNRCASRSGFWRGRGERGRALRAARAGERVGAEPWAPVRLLRYRLESGQDPVAPQDGAGSTALTREPPLGPVDARALEAAMLWERGQLTAAKVAVAEVLAAAPTHPVALLVAERLYTRGAGVDMAWTVPEAP